MRHSKYKLKPYQDPRRKGKNPDPARPLHHKRQEAFARAFADTFDPKEAVERARYRHKNKARVATRLLSIKAMQDRIRYLQRRDAEALDTVKLVQSLYFDQKSLLTKAFVRNPFTGEASFDLSRLSPNDLSQLDFKLSAPDGRFGSGAAVSLQSGAVGTLTALARIISDPDYAPERAERKSFAAAVRDISYTNRSFAPIRNQYKDDDS